MYEEFRIIFVCRLPVECVGFLSTINTREGERKKNMVFASGYCIDKDVLTEVKVKLNI